MANAAVKRLVARVANAKHSDDAESALRELAALDDATPAIAAEHPPVGDLYSALAGTQFHEGSIEEGIRLQSTALEHPCTRRRFEQGTLLGYRFVGLEDTSALEDLRASRSGGASDALLLSGFAVQVEPLELALALRLHDEALEIASGAKPADAARLRDVAAARDAARADAGLPPEDDHESTD